MRSGSVGGRWLVAGIDEVGRGCLVGPVVAAVVVLGPGKGIEGLADSKTLTARQRQILTMQIKERALDWAVGRAEAGEIDRINILQASLLAMKRAFAALAVQPEWAQADGMHYPDIPCHGETVVKGDQRVAEISAASILAKVARDREMELLDRLCPGYSFAAHKGYPTQLHLACLGKLGVTRWHRKSFGPVRSMLREAGVGS